MTRARTTVSEDFVLLFNAVKKAAKNEPARVRAFYSQHSDLQEAVDRLFHFMSPGGPFSRAALHAENKIHQRVPKAFLAAYQDFKKNWESVVSSMPREDLWKVLKIESPVPTTFEIEKKSHPNPPWDTYFNPMRHNGASAFSYAFISAQSDSDNVEFDSETGELGKYVDDIHIMAKIGLEAYDYLTGTIGFDPNGVFRRWDKVPVIFMPAHVSNKHGLEKGSLNHLIDDAVKAYVFGAPAAAMAMCRAALEMILKHHYNLDYQYKDRKGNSRDKGLGDLIILADEKYEFVQGARIRRYSDTANKIMHSYDRNRPLSDEDEKIILEFIQTLKFLIERAPDP